MTDEARFEIFAAALAEDPDPDDQRALQRDAFGFVPNVTFEAARVQREKNPTAYDHDLRAMGGRPVEHALYEQARSAAIKLGTFKPEESK